eukprot:Nk52_evm65s152 gene=Nk52_evmTU65s152
MSGPPTYDISEKPPGTNSYQIPGQAQTPQQGYPPSTQQQQYQYQPPPQGNYPAQSPTYQQCQQPPGQLYSQQPPYQQPPQGQFQQPSPSVQYHTQQPGAQQYPVPSGQPAPGQIVFMPQPSQRVDCPRGLEYLLSVDQLLIHQQVELLEAFTGIETNNKYLIKNTLGQVVFFAAEDTGCCNRQCCGKDRAFTIN